MNEWGTGNARHGTQHLPHRFPAAMGSWKHAELSVPVSVLVSVDGVYCGPTRRVGAQKGDERDRRFALQ